MSTNQIDCVFDDIMLQIGNSGKFQRHYNLIFNFFFIIFVTMASCNTILILDVPQHWCHVPGREASNLSMEDWKMLNIPWKNGTSHKKFSKCEMYEFEQNETTIIGCHYGWEYDDSYYKTTIASQENWVCNESIHVTYSLLVQKCGEIIGTFIFGQVGDSLGRRPVFMASLATLAIGKISTVFTSSVYPMFLISLLVGSLSGLSMYQACLVIAMEISSDEDRTYIALLQCLAWTCGLCLLPLIYWLVGEWIPFMVVSTLPVLFSLVFYKYLIESPRWLATKGRMKKCAAQLRIIAKFNNSELTDKILMALNKEVFTPEKVSGLTGLVSSRAMAKKTLLIVIAWICSLIIYIILFLNINNLGGNPFMNYFWQGLAELPGYIIGKYLSDFLGRKFTSFGSFAMLIVFSAIMSHIISDPDCQMWIIIFSFLLKLLTSSLFYAINLHTLELYPTCLRQTGTSVGYLVASVFALIVPYIIYMGIQHSPKLPYIIAACLASIGGVFIVFLPETMDQKLPQTLKEAEIFGADQKLWSWPRRRKRPHSVPINEI